VSGNELMRIFCRIYCNIIHTNSEFLVKQFSERWLCWFVVETLSQGRRTRGQFLIQPKTFWTLPSIFKFKVSNLLSKRASEEVIFPKSKNVVRMILIMFESSSGDMAHDKVYWQRPVKEGWRQRIPCALIGQQYWTEL